MITETEPETAADVGWHTRVDDRLDKVEGRLGQLEVGLAAVQAHLPHLATKADLERAINALTWKLILASVALAGVVIAAVAAAAAWIKLF